MFCTPLTVYSVFIIPYCRHKLRIVLFQFLRVQINPNIIKVMQFILNLAIHILSVFITAYIIPGVEVETIGTAVVVSLVLGIINTFVKPILVILTLPLTIITLGFFYIFINVGVVYLAAYIVPGFMVSGFLSAFMFSLVLSLFNSFFSKVAK